MCCGGHPKESKEKAAGDIVVCEYHKRFIRVVPVDRDRRELYSSSVELKDQIGSEISRSVIRIVVGEDLTIRGYPEYQISQLVQVEIVVGNRMFVTHKMGTDIDERGIQTKVPQIVIEHRLLRVIGENNVKVDFKVG